MIGDVDGRPLSPLRSDGNGGLSPFDPIRGPPRCGGAGRRPSWPAAGGDGERRDWTMPSSPSETPRPFAVAAFTVSRGRIAAIDIIVDPDKLRGVALGP